MVWKDSSSLEGNNESNQIKVIYHFTITENRKYFPKTFRYKIAILERPFENARLGAPKNILELFFGFSRIFISSCPVSSLSRWKSFLPSSAPPPSTFFFSLGHEKDFYPFGSAHEFSSSGLPHIRYKFKPNFNCCLCNFILWFPRRNPSSVIKCSQNWGLFQ